MRHGSLRTISVVIATVALAAAVPTASDAASRAVAGASSMHRVEAVLVKSWGSCNPKYLIWRTLNHTWSDLGSIPIHVDVRNAVLCPTDGTFTLPDLEASGADVVILSDAGGHQFTADEVTALQQYAEEGHNLVGTFLTFAYKHVDNGPVATLFGLVDSGWAAGSNTDETYDLKVHQHGQVTRSLFRNLPDPYVSSGYAQTQRPRHGTWTHDDLAGARIVATNADATIAITVFDQPQYHATYISTMPEYGGGADDLQFMYNAIVYPRVG